MQETTTLAEAPELLEAKYNVLPCPALSRTLIRAYASVEVERMENTDLDFSTFFVNSSKTATLQDNGGAKMTKDRATLYCHAPAPPS